jgi:uncharacterized membrane protein
MSEMATQKLNLQANHTRPIQTSSLSVVSLVLGVFSYFAIPLFGAIAAIITGNLARKEIRENPKALTGEGLARWGMILGWVNVGISVIGLCVTLAIVVMTVLTALGLISLPLLLIPFTNGG